MGVFFDFISKCKKNKSKLLKIGILSILYVFYRFYHVLFFNFECANRISIVLFTLNQ